VGNVSLASPLGPGGGNALGYAWCSGRHNRTMSRLGRLWSKAEGSNRTNSNRNQNFTHGGLLPNDGCVPSLAATQFTLYFPQSLELNCPVSLDASPLPRRSLSSLLLAQIHAPSL